MCKISGPYSLMFKLDDKYSSFLAPPLFVYLCTLFKCTMHIYTGCYSCSQTSNSASPFSVLVLFLSLCRQTRFEDVTIHGGWWQSVVRALVYYQQRRRLADGESCSLREKHRGIWENVHRKELRGVQRGRYRCNLLDLGVVYYKHVYSLTQTCLNILLQQARIYIMKQKQWTTEVVYCLLFHTIYQTNKETWSSW